MTTHKRGCICTKCEGERAALEHVAEDIKRRIQNEATALALIQQCKDKDSEIARLQARCERLELIARDLIAWKDERNYLGTSHATIVNRFRDALADEKETTNGHG